LKDDVYMSLYITRS